MIENGTPRVQLIDDCNGPGRTTATLVASLSARLATLSVVSAADAVGSLTAGFAALGRETSRTAEGARLRKALESGRAGNNGNALWSALRISLWVSGLPASPVLDQLRNDVALLMADDLEAVLALLPIPPATAAALAADDQEPYTFLDCVLGLWAFSTELVRSVEALAEPTADQPGYVVNGTATGPDSGGPLLR
jgi:hypothetical protein